MDQLCCSPLQISVYEHQAGECFGAFPILNFVLQGKGSHHQYAGTRPLPANPFFVVCYG